MHFSHTGCNIRKGASIEQSPENKEINALYPLLSPNIDKDPQGFIKPFREDVAKYINAQVSEGKATSVSVYFRALSDGYMFGINEHDNYRPASLLKVPVMIAYLKMAQDTPAILQRKVLFAKKIDPGVPNKIDVHIEPGNTYTIQELVQQMIVHSDNDALILLVQNMNDSYYRGILKDFGVNNPAKIQVWDDYLSLSDYVRFFRVLYNASYLNKDMSQLALKYLSESTFSEGILSGTNNVKVAHKFGEWFYNGLYQLHDCGIVYFNNQPYILGIMTKGKNTEDLAKVIQGISHIVYSNVSKGV
jgi:beta-lactamase class A